NGLHAGGTGGVGSKRLPGGSQFKAKGSGPSAQNPGREGSASRYPGARDVGADSASFGEIAIGGAQQSFTKESAGHSRERPFLIERAQHVLSAFFQRFGMHGFEDKKM